MALTLSTVTPATGAVPGQKLALVGTGLDTVDFFFVGNQIAQVASTPTPTPTALSIIVPANAPTGSPTTVRATAGTTTVSAAVTLAASTTNNNATSTLNRNWAVDILDPQTGQFVKVWFVKTFQPKFDPNFTDDTTFDDNGAVNRAKTGLDNTLSVKVSRKQNLATGQYDRAQEIMRLASVTFGGSGVVTARWYKRDGSPEAWQNNFDVKWSEDGGGAEDPDTVSVDLMGKGFPTAIANPIG